MDISNWKDIFDIVQKIVTAIAIIIGGIWAFRKYILQRENVAKLHSSLEVTFISKNRDCWITEIAVIIENKGLVKHIIYSSSFLFEARYISKNKVPVNESLDNNHRTYQIGFDKSIYLNDKQEIKNKWLPENWDYITIEPGIRRKISLIISIPDEAKVFFLRSSFKLYGIKRPYDSSKVFIEVPS